MTPVSPEIHEHMVVLVRQREADLADAHVMLDQTRWTLMLKRQECEALHNEMATLKAWIMSATILLTIATVIIIALVSGVLR